MQNYIPEGVQNSVFEMYMEMRGIYYQVKQASAAHNFYYGYSGAGKEKSDKKFNELKELLTHINLKIPKLLTPIKTYSKNLGNRV